MRFILLISSFIFLTFVSRLHSGEEYQIRTLDSLGVPSTAPLSDTRQWEKVPSKDITSGEILVARVGAAHDGEHLYLVYLVKDSSPLKNRGQDPQNHYKEGDNCDLMIGPFRSSVSGPGQGDLRLLFTPLDPPVTTVYRQVHPGGDPDFKVEFKSPVRSVWMDLVSQMDGIEIVFGTVEGGYSCVAKVPFDQIGVKYAPGLKMIFDLGVLSSNDGGILTERRAYLYNQKANVVMDVPTEAELTPAEWGVAVFE